MAGYNGKACEDFISRRRRSAGLHASANSANGFLVAIRKRATTAASWKQKAARSSATDRDPYADPAAPYKPNRSSISPGKPPSSRDRFLRQECHDPQGRLAHNRGSDGWKIKGIAGCILYFEQR